MKNSSPSPPSIALVTVWSGPLPAYLSLFLATAGANSDIDFFFVADQPVPGPLPSNVTWVEQSWGDIRKRVGESVGLDVPVSDPYKSCDFKPVFGLAFEDLVGTYDFWGHVDCDMVLGNIRQFVTHDILNEYEVVTLRGKGFIHGPLSIFKNVQKINDLYLRAEGWEDAFTDPEHWSFGETGGWYGWWRDGTSRYSEAGRPADTRASMTEVTHAAAAKGELKWYDVDVCNELGTQRHFYISDNPKRIKIIDRIKSMNWSLGRLSRSGNDIAFYHLIFAKLDPAFRVPDIDPCKPPESFQITRKGVRESSEVRDIMLDVVWASRKGRHILRSTARWFAGGVQRLLSAAASARPATPASS